ncbi:MAG: zinc-dependent metalloprotease [Vicinamibacteraceae bacterium]
MRTAILACLPLLVAGCASRSTTAPTKPAAPAAKSPAASATPPTTSAPTRPASGDGAEASDEAGPGRAERREAPDLRPYDRVITKDAKSDPGVFTVHRIRDRVYYEIPKDMLGREFLWVSQIASNTPGAGFGGQAAGNRVVRWERRDRRILLRSVSYEMVADPAQPIARAVHAANFDTILMAFPIVTMGKSEAPVIEVSPLFTTEVPEFNVRARLRARGFDPSRAFVERVKAFPTNVEVRAIHTFTTPNDPAGGGAGGPGPGAPNAPPSRPGSSSVLMSYSMVLLPEKPMQPRLHDDRVGFFSLTQLDYGVEEHRAPERRYITRWRLEKKDPAAAVSEPVKPIVYYIDPATPAKWVPYVKAGVEAWQSAFEAAGFRKAIVAKDAPTPAEDPEWSPEDARYSVIRWLPSTVENAQGPHVRDPRSGEILESDILMYHNVMNLLTHWYFVQAGPLDPRAKTLPLPDALMGELVRYVVAHEVGHTLGLPHNMKASSLYPFSKLRDPTWLKENGHTPTIMDYSRFNYVVQPEDGVPAADLVPKIGPYDLFAIKWGYQPIAGAASPDAERKTLDEWARQQDQTPWLRFSTSNSAGSDPGELTEAVGDADAIQATTLGLKNLERVGGMLLSATVKPGEPYDDLQLAYTRLLGQWVLEMNHVSAIVGGFDSQQKHGGQAGVLFTPITKARQVAAVQFLGANAFQTPTFLVNPEVLRRIEPTGALDRLRTAQQRVLASLLSSARVLRLVEREAIDGAGAYAPTDFLADVRRGVWTELAGPAPVRITAFRRNLQRAYLETLADRVNGRQAASDDARALFRQELRLLGDQLQGAVGRGADGLTRAHLADARALIQRALDPTVQAAAQAAGPRPASDSLSSSSDTTDGVNDLTTDVVCWPDYAIAH